MNPLDITAHRPYPLPKRPWMMTQTWNHLLFAHWPITVSLLETYIPQPLQLDVFGGTGWISIVPFNMTNIRIHGLPPIPFTSSFPEINVRTYVTFGGVPGVLFFSLDASHRLAVETARALLHLPYLHAKILVKQTPQGIHYISERTDRRGAKARFNAIYHPVSAAKPAIPGTLEHWLTERYCLYTVNNGTLYRGDIHHLPWPLQHAEAEVKENSMPLPMHLSQLKTTAPILHYADRIQTYIWPLQKMN